MVAKQIGNVVGVTSVGGDNLGESFNDADLATLAAMKARLAVIDEDLYTSDYLNTMTWNDMVYAIRVNDNAATVG